MNKKFFFFDKSITKAKSPLQVNIFRQLKGNWYRNNYHLIGILIHIQIVPPVNCIFTHLKFSFVFLPNINHTKKLSKNS